MKSFFQSVIDYDRHSKTLKSRISMTPIYLSVSLLLSVLIVGCSKQSQDASAESGGGDSKPSAFLKKIANFRKPQLATEQGGYERTGYYDLRAIVDSPQILWSVKANLPRGYSIAPIVRDGVIYFGGLGHFSAVSTDTGKELWRIPLRNIRPQSSSERVGSSNQLINQAEAVSSTATFQGDSIVFGTNCGALYGVDAKSGGLKFVYDNNPAEPISNNPIVVGNVVYYACDKYLCAYDANSKSLLWRFQCKGEPGNIAYDGTMLFLGGSFTGYRGSFYAVRARDGVEVWSVEPERATPTGDMPCVSDDQLFVSSTRSIYGFEKQMGKRRWQIDSPGESGGNVAYHDNILYISSSHKVVAINTRTGGELWMHQFSRGKRENWLPLAHGSPSIAGCVLYVPTDETLDALEIKTGKLLWRVFVDRRNLESSLAVDNGRLFMFSGNELVAFGKM